MATKPRAALQTFHALKASDLAAAFNDALRRLRLNPGDYGAELTKPEGPSTAGGVQALQHVRLVPRQPGLPTLVAGHANFSEERAELRTFEHLDAVHRQRFRKPLALDRGQYEDFLRLAKQILEVLHLKTAITGTPLDLDDDEAPPSGSKSWVVAVVLLVALAGIGAAVWRLGGLAGLTRMLGKG
jgi:hypothetical protein